MTFSNGVPDWRERIGPTHDQSPAPSPVVSRGGWSTRGVVTSELEAPWYTRAGGARTLGCLSLLTYVVALAVAGRLAALATATVISLLPLLLLLSVFCVVVSMLPGGRFLAVAMLGVGLRGAGRARGNPGSTTPGRQLTLTGAAGEVEEVLVASSRRLPAGTSIRVFGPRLLGRRHAWFVRSQGGLVPSRGVVPALVASAVLVALSAVTLLEAMVR